MRYHFNATLLADVGVEAETRVEAEQKLREALTGSDATLGTLEGKPIVVRIEIEGSLDLIDVEEGAENGPITAAS
jgi:hypothetical protein